MAEFLEAWGKTSEQLQKLPKSQLRDDAQAKIDDLLQKYQDGQASYAVIYQQRRATMLRTLGFLRLSGVRGWYRRIAAFLFYTAVVLLVQTIHLVWADEMPWEFIGWFVLAAVLFWVLSWPGKMRKA